MHSLLLALLCGEADGLLGTSKAKPEAAEDQAFWSPDMDCLAYQAYD